MKVINLDKNGKEIDLKKVEIPKELQIALIKVYVGGTKDENSKGTRTLQTM